MVENGRAILCASVASLAIDRGRVVKGEEQLQDLAIGNHGRVEGDLDHLDMPGVAGAHFLIRGAGNHTAGVARYDLVHAAELLEDGFDAPETTAAEGGEFSARGGSRGLLRRG